MDSVNFEMIFAVIGAVVTGLVAVLAVLAPITKTQVDNKALAALRWIQDHVLELLKKLTIPRRLR